MKFTVNEFFKHPNSKRIIILICCIGIALIFISGIGDKKNEPTAVTVEKEATTDDYADMLENKLLSLIGNIDGAGTTQVMVTLESSVEYIYASEEKSNVDLSQEGDKKKNETTNSEKKLILVENSDGDEQALVCTQIQPKVKGVVVICQGGDDPIVRQRVVDVVTTALDISSLKVCVTRCAG